jgi:hypothetical protein
MDCKQIDEVLDNQRYRSGEGLPAEARQHLTASARCGPYTIGSLRKRPPKKSLPCSGR